MTEPLYIVLSLLTLVILKKVGDEDQPIKTYIAGGAIACLAIIFYLRLIGVVLLLATITHFLFKKKFIKALFIGVSVFLLISPWVYRNAALSTSLSFTEMEEVNSTQLTEDWLSNLPYYYQFFEGEGLWKNKDSMFIKKMCFRVAANSKFYFKSVARVIFTSLFLTEGWEEETCFPFYAAKINNYFGVGKGNFNTFLAFLIAGTSVVGYLKMLIKRHDLISIYVLIYMGLILVGPIRIMEDRYLVPLLPFIFLYFVIGLKFIIELLCSHLHIRLGRIGLNKALQRALIAVIIISNFALCVLMIGESISGTISKRKARFSPYPKFYRKLFSLAQWTNKNTPKDAVVMTQEAPLFYLYAKRKVAYPSLNYGNVDYIVATPFIRNGYSEGMLCIDAYQLENEAQLVHKVGDAALFKLNSKP